MIQGLFATCAQVVRAAGTGSIKPVKENEQPNGVVFMTEVEERSYRVDYIPFTLENGLRS